jgi:DNA recombination protein RmuC
MVATETILGAAVLVLAIALVVSVVGDDGGVDETAVQHSVGQAIADLNLDSAAAVIENHAAEMKNHHSDIQQLLRTPQQRGGFGEQQLEVILADQLPPDTYHVREAVVGNARPDAAVETPNGLLPIDSKFPLEAYERYLDADTAGARQRHANEFANAVETHLEKIRESYVRPAEGTTPFAFAFIPSESVYNHLTTEEYDLLKRYANEGVQVVSPLTLGHKLQLIQAGVHAQQLSERAEKVQKQLQRLDRRFAEFEDEWETFMGHLDNAAKRADDADRKLSGIREEFDEISRLDPEE